MRILLVVMSLFLASCGDNITTLTKITYVGVGNNTAVTVATDNDEYITVASDVITISNKSNIFRVASSTTITYVAAEKGLLQLDVGNLTVQDLDDTIDFGTLGIQNINVNKLNICGTGGDEKCTRAVVRLYTTEVAGYPGVAGFVNLTDAYGVDIFGGVGYATSLVGLDTTGAAIVSSYTIPANDRKLTASDFGDPVYILEADFTNAGYGNYEMNLVVEVAVAL